MNAFLLLVIALAVTGTLGVFLGEIFILMIVVALAAFYAALFLFAPTIIDAISDATKNVLIIATAEHLRGHPLPQGLRVKVEWLRTARG
jgi:hypothetical protein